MELQLSSAKKLLQNPETSDVQAKQNYSQSSFLFFFPKLTEKQPANFFKKSVYKLLRLFDFATYKSKRKTGTKRHDKIKLALNPSGRLEIFSLEL